jgi:hypothetical protein
MAWLGSGDDDVLNEDWIKYRMVRSHRLLSLRYATNADSQPTLKRFRRIKITNTMFAARVWAFPAARAALAETGWQTGCEEGRLVLPPDTPASLLMERVNRTIVRRLGVAGSG